MLFVCVVLLGCTKSEPQNTASGSGAVDNPAPTEKPQPVAKPSEPAVAKPAEPTPTEQGSASTVEQEILSEVGTKYPTAGCGGVRVTGNTVTLEAANPDVLDETAIAEVKKVASKNVGAHVEVKVQKK